MQRLFITFFIAYCLLLQINAQHYLPNVTSFTKDDYGAGRQNWDIDIDDKGVVYFANSAGLLCNIYGEWKHVKTEEGLYLRAVLAENDTVWCGGAEIGFFVKHNGQLQYKNLYNLEGEQVWNIASTATDIVFQTEYSIGFYNKLTKQFTLNKMSEAFWTMCIWNGKLWLSDRDGYFGYLSNREFKKVAYFEKNAKQEVRKMFVHNDLLYLVFFEGGVFQFDGKEFKPVLIPESLRENTLFTGLSYDNENICLGTVSAGFIQCDNNGDQKTIVNSGHGLIDNTVLSMATDKMGNVWLGLDYGVAKVELQSAVNYVFKGAATFTKKVYKGQTYVGTNKGVYRLSEQGVPQTIENIEGQVWKLRAINDELYICHNRGLYKLKDDKAEPAFMIGGFLDIVHFKGTDHYILSTYYGLVLARHDGKRFHYVKNLEIWGNEKLAYDAINNCIWAEIKNEKMYRLSLDENLKVIKEEFNDIKHLYDTSNGLFFDDGNQIMAYKNKRFEVTHEPLLDQIACKGLTALDYSEDGRSVAYICDDEIKLKMLLSDGNIHSYDAILKSLSNDIVEYHQFIEVDKQELVLATDRGLVVFDLNFSSTFNKSSQPVISSVNVLNEKAGKKYYPYNEERVYLGKGNKSIEFRFGINKSNYDEVEYRYRLLPVGEWSEWSVSDEAIFSNLKGGKYTLSIQSRLNGGNPVDAELAFKIDKLWYQTFWVILPIIGGFLLILSVVVLIMTAINKGKLNRQKQDMLSAQASETLQMKNEQLLQYTEIISHKNEFLNKLKDGLESMRNQDAQRFVNMISDEVNNEKKEFLFHKLFSEVQQDFINRLTDVYPTLTSNDVRTLSFIRINLDKKEIANLMNITPRSLDTNRYRLRKKLDLDQQTDLDQFIRNF
ncbi:triple tyrosine motif-containing protein [Carboxylicivirga sp. RSCT41]|uniref:triple tyrosine motif-containing protein n=1 Tax=Carboxylicivirga agarovorans TaxID=3417570 RepID=UPI003D344019